jgi:histidinol dehydrogenase
MKIRRLSTNDSSFDADLKALLAFETAQDDSLIRPMPAQLRNLKLAKQKCERP